MDTEKQILILNSILNSVQTIVYLLDIGKSRIHFLNDGYYEQLGYPKSETDSITFEVYLEKIHPSDQSAYKSHIEAILAGREKKFAAFEYRLKKINGEWKWYSDTISNLKTDITDKRELIGYAIDVNNMRKKEEKYQREEIRLKAILENTLEYYFFLDLDFKIQSLNKNAKNFLQRKYHRSLFEDYSILDFLPLETASVFIEKFKYALDGAAIQYESQFQDEKGESQWYQLRYIPIRDRKERITSVCFIFLDITEIRRINKTLLELNRSLEDRVIARTKELKEEVAQRINTEDRLLVALEKAKELSDLKAKFIALVSHEFKTPMTTISMSTEMLLEYGEGYSKLERDRHYNRIKQATVSLNNLTEGVLNISRSEVSPMQFQPTIVNVKSFITSLMADFESDYSKNKFVVILPKDENCIFNLDLKLIKHSLENLLSNAIKYSPIEATITLETIVTDQYIEFIVKDKGLGIPEEDQGQVFETFYRGSNVGNISGTGLGLNLVKYFVALQKGFVSFISSPGLGTEFHIKLPSA